MSKIKPAELVANWKAISVLVLLVLTLIGCAGSPKIQVEVERPPNLDVSGIKRIAVMPGNDKYFEQSLIKRLQNYFTVVDFSEIRSLLENKKSVENHVDAIVYWNASSAYGMYENKYSTYITYTTTARVTFNYHIKTTDGRIIGPISRTEKRWAGNGDNKHYPPQKEPYEEAVRYLLAKLAEDIAPYKVTEQRTLAEDKTGTSEVKAEMKKALAYVKAKEYQLALESYLGIYERYKSPAAAENASILREFLSNKESAKTTQQPEEKIAPIEEEPVSIISGELADARDGKKYKTVKIDEQTWMAENLNYDAKGSKCYDKKPANCEKYGRLYDWSTAKSACPSGWHLPSNGEWGDLYRAVVVEQAIGKKLKAKNGWNGTDNYGFSALPGGWWVSSGFLGGRFNDVGNVGYWWSSTESGGNSAWARDMGHDDGANKGGQLKASLLSVRCLHD